MNSLVSEEDLELLDPPTLWDYKPVPTCLVLRGAKNKTQDMLGTSFSNVGDEGTTEHTRRMLDTQEGYSEEVRIQRSESLLMVAASCLRLLRSLVQVPQQKFRLRQNAFPSCYSGTPDCCPFSGPRPYFAYAHTCVYVCVYVCTGLWKLEDNLSCHFSDTVHLAFGTGSPTALELSRLCFLVSDSRESACLCLPSSGLISTHSHS